ncbi:hypothetical protein CICLE_v10003855mg [Citrus x clementina]|uniref:VOC domain-containing protein n=1 Tax=Citrus clementina TaxID=85681 RepID=V4SXF1_CITCL|nr:hypothetical protein CICLE_v10003855mg [Citrus x clementina]
MPKAPPTIANAELLEWPKKDKLCFLHDVYGVVDTIKFYTECFEIKLLRKEMSKRNTQMPFFDLAINSYGFTLYDIGTSFRHFTIVTGDVIYKMVENILAKGGIVSRELGLVKGGTTHIVFVKDLDGYIFYLI